MAGEFSAIAMIAESRIREALEKGELDNLPGAGRPLEFEDMSHVPEELRLAYKMLKNAGCLPPELEDRKEAGRLMDLLDACPPEREKIKAMKRLRLILSKAGFSRSSLNPALDDSYYAKLMARLERHEGRGG